MPSRPDFLHCSRRWSANKPIGEEEEIAERGEPLLIFNALDMSWREIRVRKDPAAQPVTELADYQAFCNRHGDGLVDFATWNVLAELHGNDYRTWPKELQDPAAAEVVAFREAHEAEVDFHMWLQWVVDEQLQLAQAKAVGVTVIWSGVVAAVSFKIVDLVIGLRVTEEEERESLDISSLGETAYSK